MEKSNRNIAYIGFGSNLDDRLAYIKNAVLQIKKNENCKFIKISAIYETKPLGEANQPDFLNAVAKIETELSVKELFNFLKEVEKKVGRKDSYKWGPREIDLDLLFFNDIVYSDENLTIPHPGISQRDFVLKPLAEIEPTLFHPVLKQKISDIYILESEENIIRIVKEKIP